MLPVLSHLFHLLIYQSDIYSLSSRMTDILEITCMSYILSNYCYIECCGMKQILPVPLTWLSIIVSSLELKS